MNPSAAESTRLRNWLIGFGIWTGLALFSAGQGALSMANAQLPIPWRDLIVGRLADWYALAVFTPLLFWLSRRFPAVDRPHARNVSVLIACSIPIVVAKYALYVPVARLLFPKSTVTVQGVLMRNLIIETLCTWAALGVIHAILFYRRMQAQELQSARLAADLAESRLDALTHQLQPHFLFNTLNSVVTLIRRDTAAAEYMLVSLGEMLHRALDERPVVSLASEVDLLRKYIDIMQRRFGHDLETRIDIAPDVRQVPVPRFLLQPLVENSFEHGIAKRGQGIVDVRARRVGDRVEIVVDDDGPGFVGAKPVPQVGLNNTMRRLNALYGTRHSLTYGRASLGGASVTVSIPAE